MNQHFPPRLEVGNRVWTTRGYRNHGPVDGPTVNIAADMGGTITAAANVGYTLGDSLLYSVLWDNGQTSKHYSNGLFCIGRFATRTDFANSIKLIGPIELTTGPMGGFRHCILSLEYDGQVQKTQIWDRELWIDCLEPLAKGQGVEVSTIRLPGKPRRSTKE
jgi:hypothetical protein